MAPRVSPIPFMVRTKSGSNGSLRRDKDKKVRRRNRNFGTPPTESLIVLRQYALELRIKGHSFADIAKKLGVSIATVGDHINAELYDLRERTRLDAESLRDIELSRVDTILLGLGPRIRKGDPAAAGAAIRALERRAALLGLDAPKRTEVIGAITTLDAASVSSMSEADIAKRLDEVKQRLLGVGTVDAEVVKVEQ